jgi:glycerophosphoryl diester phosphodiesterase
MSGFGRVLMSPYYKGQVSPTPLQNMLVRSYLAQQAFEPSWDFCAFAFEPRTLVPWPALADWIPIRVNDWLDRLAHEISPSSYRFLRIGHAGASAHAPANTLSSLHKAAELGADMVAFDLQQTADGQVVLAHLPYIHDAGGKVWPVRESTLAALQAIDLGGGERVPTLAEALEVCRSEQVGPYIVLKDGDAIPAIVDAIREHNLAGYSIFGSFRPDWLADLKAQVPEVQMAILFGSPHVDAVKLAQSIGATYIQPCWETTDISAFLTPDWVGRAREAGLGIIGCHDGQPDGLAALQRAGVDAICSPAPELLQIIQ